MNRLLIVTAVLVLTGCGSDCGVKTPKPPVPVVVTPKPPVTLPRPTDQPTFPNVPPVVPTPGQDQSQHA